MIKFTFQSDVSAKKIANVLRTEPDKAKDVLKRALNQTAKRARTMLTETAQERYVVKKGAFNKGAKIKNARKNKPEATITFSGRSNMVNNFKTNPATYKQGKTRPDVYRGKVLRGSPLKDLYKDGQKAFIVRFANGHVGTVARVKGASNFPLKTLYSPSNPSMIGARKVYGVLRPKIGQLLEKEMQVQMEKAMKGA